MTRNIRQAIALFLAVAVLGVLAWRLWPDGGRAQQQQRNSDLVRAVLHNRQADAVRLLDEGADPNTQYPAFSLSQKAHIYYFGVTHRIKTPGWQHPDDMNPRWSVLQIAVMRGNTDIVSVLLSKGADVRYRNKQGDTALDWAGRMNGIPAMAAFGNTRDYPRIAALLKAAALRQRPVPHP